MVMSFAVPFAAEFRLDCAFEARGVPRPEHESASRSSALGGESRGQD